MHYVILLQYKTAPTDALCYIVTTQERTNQCTMLYCYNTRQHQQMHYVILLQHKTAPTDALFILLQ